MENQNSYDDPISYRSLLIRYMRHVMQEEGCTFTDYLPQEVFTVDEQLELEDFAKVIEEEYYTPTWDTEDDEEVILSGNVGCWSPEMEDMM